MEQTKEAHMSSMYIEKSQTYIQLYIITYKWVCTIFYKLFVLTAPYSKVIYM